MHGILNSCSPVPLHLTYIYKHNIYVKPYFILVFFGCHVAVVFHAVVSWVQPCSKMHSRRRSVREYGRRRKYHARSIALLYLTSRLAIYGQLQQRVRGHKAIVPSILLTNNPLLLSDSDSGCHAITCIIVRFFSFWRRAIASLYIIYMVER